MIDVLLLLVCVFVAFVFHSAGELWKHQVRPDKSRSSALVMLTFFVLALFSVALFFVELEQPYEPYVLTHEEEIYKENVRKEQEALFYSTAERASWVRDPVFQVVLFAGMSVIALFLFRAAGGWRSIRFPMP